MSMIEHFNHAATLQTTSNVYTYVCVKLIILGIMTMKGLLEHVVQHHEGFVGASGTTLRHVVFPVYQETCNGQLVCRF